MDPTSISVATASLIKLVSNTSLSLYKFINEVKDVDQSVKDLANEIESLKRALSEIHSVLQEPKIIAAEERISTRESEQLWNTLSGCLEDCQMTTLKLDSALDEVRETSSSWTRQTFRQVKLNLRKDDINSLRIQFHTHYLALGTALKMVNIRASYLGPSIVIADLGPMISGLQQSMKLMVTSLEDLKLNTPQMNDGPVQVEPTNTKKLHNLGSRILARANTVYTASVDGESVLGEQVSSETFHRTMNWIPEPAFHGRAQSVSSTTKSSGVDLLSSSTNSGYKTSITQSSTTLVKEDVIYTDSDTEFDLELAQKLLDKGALLFKSKDYKKALGFLQNGVTKYNNLPLKTRSQLDAIEVPLMIATCKFHLNEIDEASNELNILMRRESISDQDAIQKCQISHLLSQISLMKNDTEAAEDYCRNSLKARRRMLGKTHADYFASLALLSEICVMREKNEEAAIYKEMLPKGYVHNIDMDYLRNTKYNQNYSQSATSVVKVMPNPSSASPIVAPAPSQTMQNSREQPPYYSWVRIFKGHVQGVYGVSFSPDGSLLASASGDKTVRLWDVRSGSEVQMLRGHTKKTSGVSFSPDGLLLASASVDKTIRLWDVESGREVRKLEGHTYRVYEVSFSPDGSLLASVSDDKSVRLWDVRSGRVQVLRGHTERVSGVSFSPDGLLLASASGDKTVRLWDVKSSRQIRKLEGHTQRVYGVSFSPDGLLLASASYDRTVRLWDVKRGREVQKLEGHTNWVHRISFSPDGLLLASTSYDKTVRLWDVKRGREVQKLEGHTERMYGVSFSPDGSLLATASWDMTVILWKASSN